MTPDAPEPFDGIDPSTATPEDVDDAELREALDAANPLVRQRALETSESLAATDPDALRPLLDDLVALADDDNAAVALRAIGVLDAVVSDDPSALEGRLGPLVDVADDEIVDVQLTAATVLGKLVVARPDLVAPHAHTLVEAVRTTEPPASPSGYGDVVDDPVTRQTIEEHEEGERQRRASARRTLVNVVVAVTEEEPEAALEGELVDALVTLLDDVDPSVVGGAVDALGQLAATDSSAVAPVRGVLVDCLDHGRVVVRARAIRALGYFGDDAAVPELREVAERDDDEDVRELAAETAAFLDE